MSWAVSFQLLQSLQALGAEAFAVEQDDIFGCVAENAGGHILLQDDAVSLYEQLDLVPNVDTQIFTHSLGQDDAPQLVDTFQDSLGFHRVLPFLSWLFLIFLYYTKGNEVCQGDLTFSAPPFDGFLPAFHSPKAVANFARAAFGDHP